MAVVAVSPQRVLGQHPYLKIVLVVTPLVILLIAANNQRQNEQKRRTDAQFRKALIVTDRKFQQALEITNAQTSYAINKNVCGFRALLKPALETYREAANDKTSTASARERNAERVTQTQRFLDTQVTVPSDFDCSKLPKRAPS